MTLRELKQCITNRMEVKKVPSYKKLQESKSKIILQLNIDDVVLEVYEDGFVTYSNLVGEKVRHTVFTIFNLELRYEFAKVQTKPIRLSDYPELEDYDAGELLCMCGQDRLDYNTSNREQGHIKQVLDNSGNSFTTKTNTRKKLSTMQPDFTDTLINRLDNEAVPDYSLALHDAMSHLKEKQMEVIQMYFYQNMSQQQIADKLGISRSSVQSRLDAALKKLRKYIKR